MPARSWTPTYDEAMGRGNRYFYAGQYRHAAVEYELGASVAPRDSFCETAALEEAFLAITLHDDWRETAEGEWWR